eukprot:3742699-Amphidinium_carterae.1
MSGRCEEQAFCSGWQCPSCFGLNNWEENAPSSEDEGEEDGEEEQLHVCHVCTEVVTPSGPIAVCEAISSS